jgi:hypothetical protein
MPNKPNVVRLRLLPKTQAFRVDRITPTVRDTATLAGDRIAAFEDLNHAVSIAAILRTDAHSELAIDTCAIFAFGAADRYDVTRSGASPD